MAKGSADVTEGTRRPYMMVAYEYDLPVWVHVENDGTEYEIPGAHDKVVEIVGCRVGFIVLVVDYDQDEIGTETAYLFRTGQGRADRKFEGEPGESLEPWIASYWGV